MGPMTTAVQYSTFHVWRAAWFALRPRTWDGNEASGIHSDKGIKEQVIVLEVFSGSIVLNPLLCGMADEERAIL